MKKLKNILDKIDCTQEEKRKAYKELCFLFGVIEWRSFDELPKAHEGIEIMYEDYTTHEGIYMPRWFDDMMDSYKKGHTSKPVKWRYDIR
jgi:hypothetical protein